MNQLAEVKKQNARSGHLTLSVVVSLLVSTAFLSSKAGGRWLVSSTEAATAPITPAAAEMAQAIVVLTGGDALVKEVARLHRETGLPVLASGGDGEAAAIKKQLEGDFNTPVHWTETNSLNTEQNALFSAKILARQNIHSIILVTHALHMRRARLMFSDRGLAVIPAPTRFSDYPPLQWRDFLPSAEGRKLAKPALHEIAGLAWYSFSRVTR